MSVPKHLSRRAFLQGSIVGASVLLASCAPKVIKETVVVEKEKIVEKPVEKVVEKTVVVEKEKVVTKEVVKEVVKEVAPKTAEEILGKALMPGSPDHARGWKTILPDLPAGYPAKSPATISCSRRVDAGTKFQKGDTLDNNQWSRMIEKLFNVKFTVAWTWSTGDEAATKYNTGMASGDLPDLLETVPATIYIRMVQAGLLQELGSLWDQYASPRWKQAFRDNGDLPWYKVLVDGKRMGIPRVAIVAQDATVLWYREDWLEKLGLKPPTTLDELHDTALAIKKAELGQGAKGTTVGLLATMTYANTWFGSLDSIWGAHGAIPSNWSKVGNTVVWDAIRPEAKEGLTLLNKWYKDGVFAQDFFTLTTSNAMSVTGGNMCGLHFTPSWGAQVDSVKNDPKARWNFTGHPSGPRGKAGWAGNAFQGDPMCCSKKMKYVKEWLEVENWMIDLKEDPWRRMHGFEGYEYEWKDNTIVPSGTVNWTHHAVGPIGTRGGGGSDPYASPRQIAYQFDEWGKIPPEKRDAMMEIALADPTGVATINNKSRVYITEQNKAGVYRMSEFQGMPTKTMIDRWADLVKIQDEFYISTLIGNKPISAFDDFVKQWKSMGGDQITTEVNEWVASIKK